ncbi:hypothetical protein KVP09_09965 [Alcaligenaceae bacterium CGII-47]|nr:hypothetical protein [Alcaligenaceae bacterium CGII-47]
MKTLTAGKGLKTSAMHSRSVGPGKPRVAQQGGRGRVRVFSANVVGSLSIIALSINPI